MEQIITGDEKLVCYVNVHRRRQWLDLGQEPLPDVKPHSYAKKIMLCIWWGMKGVVYLEFLDVNQTITAVVYSQQLQRLHEVLADSANNRTVWMGSSCAPALVTRPFAIRLSCVLISPKLSSRQALCRLRRTKI